MTDDADKPDKSLDENETLVNALESIKTLLATSEEKLSKARESVKLASAQSLKMTREVPVLNEVVVPGKSFESPETDLPAEITIEPETAPQIDMATFKSELEQEMRDKLAAYASELEAELKVKIQDYLNKQ